MIFRLLFLTLWLGACAQVPSVSERVDFANNIAADKGWKSEEVKTDLFTLRAYLPYVPKKQKFLMSISKVMVWRGLMHRPHRLIQRQQTL